MPGKVRDYIYSTLPEQETTTINEHVIVACRNQVSHNQK